MTNLSFVVSQIADKAMRLSVCSTLGHCYLCQLPCYINQAICATCLADFNRWPVTNLLAYPAISNAVEQTEIDQLHCLAPYQKPLSRWLNQLKYQRHLMLARLLAQLSESHLEQLLRALSSEQLPILTIVPIHSSRWGQRGFNQCHEIIKRIKHKDLCDYRPDLFHQTKAQSQQKTLSGKERRRRRRYFQLNAKYSVRGKDLVIFDDVLTTGSTVDALAKLLKAAGANSVSVFTLALSIKR
ncbi:ComF family protein [Thalassotalea sp. LPB0316]|uniref:ComF family protein n=1 Tax=Thalassotalea sp. LPB0316 TaxID=2769490 RepID=UPI0018666FD5|nr:phosphoribosyltransferase family protein [Thalassotalea sp. LPB0316]QOL26215.1 ComF family protein [Thalassotalea sp. LPB0316]